MFKVELEFDKSLPKETVNNMCDQVDEMFAEEDIPCAESSFGKKVYCSEDYGDIMCGILSIDENKKLVSHIVKATLYHGEFSPEDLIKECFHFEVA